MEWQHLFQKYKDCPWLLTPEMLEGLPKKEEILKMSISELNTYVLELLKILDWIVDEKIQLKILGKAQEAMEIHKEKASEAEELFQKLKQLFQ